MTDIDTHRIEIHTWPREAPALRLICTAAEDAPCRMRPADGREDWTADDPDLTPGHECWATEWIDATGWEDAVHGPEGVLASIPVRVSYAEGVMVEPVEPHPKPPMTDIDTAALREEWARARLTYDGSNAWAVAYADDLLDEVDRLRAERDEARATVARVEAARDGINGHLYPPRALVADLAAALTVCTCKFCEGPDTKETDRG